MHERHRGHRRSPAARSTCPPPSRCSPAARPSSSPPPRRNPAASANKPRHSNPRHRSSPPPHAVGTESDCLQMTSTPAATFHQKQFLLNPDLQDRHFAVLRLNIPPDD